MLISIYRDDTDVGRKTVSLRKAGTIVAKNVALAVMLAAAWQVMAQDAKATYPSMAPI